MSGSLSQGARLESSHISRDPSDPPTVVFIHIPKTAGTSFLEYLHDCYVPRPIDSPLDDGSDHFLSFRPKLTRALGTRSTPQSVVSGHFRLRDLIAVTDGDLVGLSLVTMLRNPVTRVLSDFFYSVSVAHPEHLGFRGRYPTLEDYLADPGQMNKQLDFLRPHDDASVEETIAYVEAHVRFVGIAERFDQSMRRFATEFGVPLPRSVFSNRGPNDTSAQEALTRLGAEIGRLHAPEMTLYERLRTRARIR